MKIVFQTSAGTEEITIPADDGFVGFTAVGGSISGITFQIAGSTVEGFGLDNISSASVIPEPSTFIIWSLLGALGLTFGSWRRKRRAA